MIYNFHKLYESKLKKIYVHAKGQLCGVQYFEVCPLYDVLSVLSTSQCWPTLTRHFVDIVQVFAVYPFILFTALTLSTFQCWLTTSRHFVYIVYLCSSMSTSQCWSTSGRHHVYIGPLISCLHWRHCQYCNVGQPWVDIVSLLCALFTLFIINIVDIAKLIDIASTLGLHWIFFIAHDVYNKEISAI